MTSTSRGARTGERRAAVLARVALLGALGAALAVIESFIPRPVPWMRLGLGHVAVVLALWTDGAGAAAGVMSLKLLLAGLVGGTIAQPTMLVSVAASAVAWAAMAAVRALAPRRYVGPVGASVAGALAYGIAQVWLVGRLLVRAPIWPIAPLVIGPGVLAGVATGLLAALVLWRLADSRAEGDDGDER